jgi:hypothetical protein
MIEIPFQEQENIISLLESSDFSNVILALTILSERDESFVYEIFRRILKKFEEYVYKTSKCIAGEVHNHWTYRVLSSGRSTLSSLNLYGSKFSQSSMRVAYKTYKHANGTLETSLSGVFIISGANSQSDVVSHSTLKLAISDYLYGAK